ncbi:MAG: heparinase II/III family protein [Lentisphaeria bacterium]|nr:heparinase II/III family protein [Lentisphaeria bacterium]
MMAVTWLAGLAAVGQTPQAGQADAGDGELLFDLRSARITPAGALQTIDDRGQLVHVFRDQPRVALRRLPTDWSAYQALALTVSCRQPLAGHYSLIIYSHNQDLPGPDYFLFTLPARFSGTHELVLPLAEMHRVRSPRGLDQIDYMEFHRDWSGKNPPDADNVITISNLRLVKDAGIANVRGPRLQDEEFFALLNLGRPELSGVKAALAAGDYASARHVLSEHIRTRREPRWLVDPRDRPGRGLPPQTLRAVPGEGGRYQATVTLDWTGWKRVELRLEDFQTVGRPLGWGAVSGFQLSWDAPVNLPAGTALHLDDVALDGPAGPRLMGDFNAIETGWNQVFQDRELTRDGTATGKWWFPDLYPDAVCRRYPADWSGYGTVAFWVHVPAPACGRLVVKVMSAAPNTVRADEILSRTFTIGSFRDHPYAFGKRIDWSCNAMSDGESRTVEWNAQLNRHFHFQYLTKAWWETGEEKYAAELAEQMNGWIEDNPVLLLRSGNSPYHHAWETLNTGIRLHASWPNALAHCLEAKAFTDDIIINILKSQVEQVRHLLRWPSTGNWLTAEAWGVYVTGLLYPEFTEAAAWRQYGIDSLYRQLQEEVYPDGLQYELALGYSNWTLQEFTDLYDAAVLNGMEHELPADYASRLEKMYVYLMANVMPGAVAFALNDAGNGNVKRRLMDGYRLFKRPEFLYAATDGQAGEPPATDSFGQEWVGHYVMRSGWHPQANVLHMDAGLLGRAHIHQDKLTLALAAYGQQLLVDGGVTMYDKSRWRAYQLLTRAHNAVLVDGMDQFGEDTTNARVWPLPWVGKRPAGSDTLWHSSPGVDYCQGWWKGRWREYVDSQNPATSATRFLDTVQHRRAVLFIKPGLWVVHDTLFASDQEPHTAEVLYHIDAETAVVDSDGGVAILATNKDRAGLRLAARPQDGLAVAIVTGKMEPPVQGWSANVKRNRQKGIPMSAVPTAIFQQSWQGRSDVVTIVQPFPATETRNTRCLAMACSPEAQAARIEVGAEEAYVWLHNDVPGKAVQAGADGQGGPALLETDGQAAVAGGTGASFRLLLIHGRRVAGPGYAASAGEPTTLAVLAASEQTLVVSTDRTTDVALSLAQVPAAGLSLHALDRRGARVSPVAFTRGADGALTWKASAGQEYELTWGGDSVLAMREAEQRVAAGLLPLPVRELPSLPAAPAGVSILIQAEDFAAQGGGRVTVTDAKTAADGRAFLNWDKTGHWLEYAVTVPADGAYPLHIRHCSLGPTAVRAIMVNGYCPHADLTKLEFPETGGWSSGQDNWAWTTVADAKGRPFLFHLRQGQQLIRFVNCGNSLNLDSFCFGERPK